MLKFSFVLLTWNRYKFLERCLEALLPALDQPALCEIVVMDNGSTDKTPEVLERYKSNPVFRIVTRKKNYGLNAYKKLFLLAKGEYIVVVDDDVLDFPEHLDTLFTDYMQSFPDYGFLALNVIQNEFTNGAKPGPELYTADTRAGKTIERGPTGGWCACLRRSDYRKIAFRMMWLNLDMKSSEDGIIAALFARRLNLQSGIIRDAVCFHASGPHYAREYGHLAREIEKYAQAGLTSFVEDYKSYESPPDKS